MKQVRITLGNLLEQRGMSIHELSLRADVRRAVISELVNGKRENINFSGIQRLRNEGLKLKDVKQLLDIFER